MRRRVYRLPSPGGRTRGLAALVHRWKWRSAKGAGREWIAKSFGVDKQAIFCTLCRSILRKKISSHRRRIWARGLCQMVPAAPVRFLKEAQRRPCRSLVRVHSLVFGFLGMRTGIRQGHAVLMASKLLLESHRGLQAPDLLAIKSPFRCTRRMQVISQWRGSAYRAQDWVEQAHRNASTVGCRQGNTLTKHTPSGIKARQAVCLSCSCDRGIRGCHA